MVITANLAISWYVVGLPWQHKQKSSCRQCGRPGFTAGLGRSPGEGMATHSSMLAWRIPTDRGACWATVHEVVRSRTWLSTHNASLCLCVHVAFFCVLVFLYSDFLLPIMAPAILDLWPLSGPVFLSIYKPYIPRQLTHGLRFGGLFLYWVLHMKFKKKRKNMQ